MFRFNFIGYGCAWLGIEYEDVLSVRIEALDNNIYFVIANFNDAQAFVPVSALCDDTKLTDLAYGQLYPSSNENAIQPPPCFAIVLGCVL